MVTVTANQEVGGLWMRTNTERCPSGEMHLHGCIVSVSLYGPYMKHSGMKLSA